MFTIIRIYTNLIKLHILLKLARSPQSKAHYQSLIKQQFTDAHHELKAKGYFK